MIDLLPSAEQQQIIDTVGGFLADRLPVSRHRRNELGGAIPADSFREIIAQGWLGLGVPERAGGVGGTIVEEALVCRELGRQLAPLGIFAGILGARVAAAAGRDEVARRIITGEARVGLALRAETEGTGGAAHVIDGTGAVYLVGLTSRGIRLAPLAGFSAPERLHPIDPTIDLDLRSRGNAPVEFIDGGEPMHWEAVLLGSALLTGMAEATRDLAVDYAKQREQFGQPIGAFQAIKHICADSALRAEAAKSQLFFAAIEGQKRSPLGPMHATASKITAADAALQNAAANIQVHGGMGFTAEADAHLYVKRTQVLEQILGPQRAHQTALGTGTTFTVAAL